jgi:preprotein translocase subunit YajC
MGETVQSLVAQSGGAAGLLGMAPFLVGMFVIMYFLMIRPERKRQQETQNMLSSLKRGDEVVLTSGVFGKIQSIDERTVVLEIADKTRIKILKQAVMGPSSRYLGAAAGGEQKKLDEKAADDADKKSDKSDDKKSDDKKSA